MFCALTAALPGDAQALAVASAALAVANLALVLWLVRRRGRSRCYDPVLKMLADEQGDWFVEKVLSHELGKVLCHNTRDLDEAFDPSETDGDNDDESGADDGGDDGSGADGDDDDGSGADDGGDDGSGADGGESSSAGENSSVCDGEYELVGGEPPPGGLRRRTANGGGRKSPEFFATGTPTLGGRGAGRGGSLTPPPR